MHLLRSSKLIKGERKVLIRLRVCTITGFLSYAIHFQLKKLQPKDLLLNFARKLRRIEDSSEKDRFPLMPDRKCVTWRMKELLLVVSWLLDVAAVREKRFNTSGNRKKLCTWANRHWSRVSRRKSLFVRRNVAKVGRENFYILCVLTWIWDLRWFLM